jgi:D-tagatose-1,6-bisphosphate aldolase subunit GatZ/KbaZ
MFGRLHQRLLQQRHGVPAGIYSVCSTHPWVIRAAAEQAVQNASLLIT